MNTTVLQAIRTMLSRWFPGGGAPVPMHGVQSPRGSKTSIPSGPDAAHDIGRNNGGFCDQHQTIHDAAPIPYDEDLLERARTQWQFGDWHNLIALDYEGIRHHPDRAKLALFVAAGHMQTHDNVSARKYIQFAQDWGCSKTLLTTILIAGVHNSLARAATIRGDHDRQKKHFLLSVQGSGGDERLLAQARASLELTSLSHSAREVASIQSKPHDHTRSTERGAEDRAPVFITNPGIVSYAQNFEDVMLWRALGHIADGFYIDIGAQDPIIDSVSKAFYEHGWRGLHVEPTPAYAKLLRQDRPDETVLQMAVANTHGSMPFYELPQTGLSTGDYTIAQRHRTKGFDVREITVNCQTLAAILASVGNRDIHWLKIDVEGMEEEVLAGWGDAEMRPWIVVVESTQPMTQLDTSGQWAHHLHVRGYTMVYFDGLNRFFVSENHPELVCHFRSGPNVFDRFTLNGTASSSFSRPAGRVGWN